MALLQLTAEVFAFWTINWRIEAEPGEFKDWFGDEEIAFRISGKEIRKK